MSEVLEIVDVPEPTPGEGQKLYDVSTAGVNVADPTRAGRSTDLSRAGMAVRPGPRWSPPPLVGGKHERWRFDPCAELPPPPTMPGRLPRMPDVGLRRFLTS